MTHHEHTHHAPESPARTPWCRTWTGLAGLGATALAAGVFGAEYGRYAAVAPGRRPRLASRGPNHPRVGGSFGA